MSEPIPSVAAPLRFRPLLKRAIWGGRRLGSKLNKPIGAENDFAESWEIVDHGKDQSVVVGGEFDGWSLGKIFGFHRQWLMGKRWVESHPDADGFPLLLKYLDCNKVLSVQVHPNDQQGALLDPPDLGKTEAWIILERTPESIVYAGLKTGVDRDQLASVVERGETEQVLHSFRPEPGDCIFIPAGTVHALGGGLLVAEIQQSSNTTFRLHDWNRTDANGNARELHVDASLDVTDYQRGPVEPIRSDTAGVEMLVTCDKFELSRIRNTESSVAGDDRCQLLTVIDGTARLSWSGGAETMETGESVLLPAAMSPAQLSILEGCALWMCPAT